MDTFQANTTAAQATRHSIKFDVVTALTTGLAGGVGSMASPHVTNFPRPRQIAQGRNKHQ